MKPKNIILVRHGLSEGNIDRGLYKTRPDFAINLTDEGKKQAHELGKHLQNHIILTNNVSFYFSPYYRTRQTKDIIKEYFPNSWEREDARLREQEWAGQLPLEDRRDIEDQRDAYGHFYYRFPQGGESCADVYDRISDFLGSLFRDFEKPDFGENCIIVTHGMTMRLFLMRFLHYTVEQFEFLKNPKNCGIYVLARQENGKYHLTCEPEKYEKRNCIY